MAKQPNVIPFQEGAPADNLEVEEIGDEVLIGNASLDDIVEITDEHDENLAEQLDANDSAKKAQNLIDAFESDKEARS